MRLADWSTRMLLAHISSGQLLAAGIGASTTSRQSDFSRFLFTLCFSWPGSCSCSCSPTSAFNHSPSSLAPAAAAALSSCTALWLESVKEHSASSCADWPASVGPVSPPAAGLTHLAASCPRIGSADATPSLLAVPSCASILVVVARVD